MKGAGLLNGLVRVEDLDELRTLGLSHGDLRARARVLLALLELEKVEEGVRGVRVVPAERLEAKLSVHEDHAVAGLQEVFRRGRASST